MRTFVELNSEERERTLRISRVALIEGIVYGILEIKFVDPRNQTKLEWILEESRKNEEPRLAMLRILKSEGLCKELNKLALVAAHETSYDTSGDRILKENLQ